MLDSKDKPRHKQTQQLQIPFNGPHQDNSTLHESRYTWQPTERSMMISKVHHKHQHIKGNGYAANDTELQKWVATTLFVEFVTVHDSFLGMLAPSAIEQIYNESAMFGTSLCMSESMWPSTIADLWGYWDRKIDSVTITDSANIVAINIMYPKSVPLWISPFLFISRSWTIYWLALHGISQDEYNIWHCFGVLMLALASCLYSTLPPYHRELPHRYYMNKSPEVAAKC
ncbi:hypothetical protein BDV41DRAFT_367739 [Aspergillus transmontanensis]|uniref:ER-bound oxygenase mpaB/mpaB'/Rubber oxygenase catalytic domain-containing protein n=1 Tax=Aspergillus transmontanensis TaxID=1034304 RepID=A0A5N6VQE8_9EURO|nr:hypothetical protein BDV41DRAFT_367739 [Aspergillus transmontanensis]